MNENTKYKRNKCGAGQLADWHDSCSFFARGETKAKLGTSDGLTVFKGS